MRHTAIRRSLIYLLYFTVRVLGAPVLVLYCLYRCVHDGRYLATLGERAGNLPASFKRTAPGSIWLHAVSVGEVITGARLIEELRKEQPGVPIYVSTTTLTGREVAEKKVGHLVDGIFYAPFDYVFATRRVIRTIRPAVVAVLETEIWPTLYHEAKCAGCGLLIVSARISDRAMPRYRKLRWVFAPVLELPDRILAQSEIDRARFLELGAPAANVVVLGNLKYDAAPATMPAPEFVRDALARLAPEQVWIAASTMPGLDGSDVDEDEVVIDAFQELARQRSGLLLILAPRRPERFDGAVEKLRARRIAVVRRSSGEIPGGFRLPGVLVLDTIGELASVFGLGDVVFMGGTLARRGGHNVLEPAIQGKPIVVGPHMENFAAIAADFRARGAWVEIDHGGELAEAVRRLLDDPRERDRLGALAAEVAARNTGVAAKAAAEILDAQDAALPLWRWSSPARPVLWMLAQLARLWMLGNHRKQRRDVATARALGRPVISVGGIAMGGSGKTPFVEMLASRLASGGIRPAILTRGYHRRSVEKMILIPAGTQIGTAYTGDEAQIFVRSGVAHVGIGADRWATGMEAQQRLNPDVFLLDDGFQHRRLRRDLDIVLIDALNPFPGGGVFPLGFLREPIEGLARADVFVITRAQPGRAYVGIRRALRRVNPDAPIFLASVQPREWVPARPESEKVAAFCGLGNPATFWETLRQEGFDPVLTWKFDDHHRYRRYELRRLAYQAQRCGARALLTTEKDAMNLPDDAGELVAPLRIYWLKIATVVREEAAFLEIVEQTCTRGAPR